MTSPSRPFAAFDPPPTDVAEMAAGIWGLAGLGAFPREKLGLTGAEPILPSSFRVDALAQATLAVEGLAAAELFRRRSGESQQVAVDIVDAAAEFRGERLLRVDGAAPPDPWDALSGLYRCGDGGYVGLHTNFPHHRAGVVALLECADTREAVMAALAHWRAEAFEEAASARGLVVAMARRFEEWDAHPQAESLSRLPLIEIERAGDGPAHAAPAGDAPLSGVRVLDLTRIIAGPVATRALASYGADVLSITAPHLPSIPSLVIDTGRGKMQTALDLRRREDRARLEALVREADVFVQGYRPGGLAALGFGEDALKALNPSLVSASLSAYGRLGPWAGKRGFDSLTQTATGLNWAEADAFGQETPRALPCQALDHGAGHLLAFGVIAALARRNVEGGFWRVETSLAQVGRFLRGLGIVPGGATLADPPTEAFAACLEQTDSAFGRLSATAPPQKLSLTPARYRRPAEPLGASAPEWPPR